MNRADISRTSGVIDGHQEPALDTGQHLGQIVKILLHEGMLVAVEVPRGRIEEEQDVLPVVTGDQVAAVETLGHHLAGPDPGFFQIALQYRADSWISVRVAG